MDTLIDSSPETREDIEEIADEVVDAFSELHPHLRMNRGEWADLREMIIREVMGHYWKDADGNPRDLHAADLLPGRHRLDNP